MQLVFQIETIKHSMLSLRALSRIELFKHQGRVDMEKQSTFKTSIDQLAKKIIGSRTFANGNVEVIPFFFVSDRASLFNLRNRDAEIFFNF